MGEKLRGDLSITSRVEKYLYNLYAIAAKIMYALDSHAGILLHRVRYTRAGRVI